MFAIWPPRVFIAVIEATAISAASNEYSMRSWPSSSRKNRLSMSCTIVSPELKRFPFKDRTARRARRGLGAARRRVERRADLGEDVVDAGAQLVHGGNRRHRDQGREQRVLDQVLAL